MLAGITEVAFSSDFELNLISQQSFLDNKSGVRQYCRTRGSVGSSYKDKDVNWVDVDNTTASFEAIEHLIRLGHRRLGLVNSPLQLQCFLDRAKGYQLALAKHGIEIDEDLIINEPLDIDISRYAVDKLMHLQDPPTALFVTSYLHTLFIMDALKQRGIRIPQDISLVGFGDYRFTSHTIPSLTTVHQPVHELGQRGAETLLKLIEGGTQEPVQIALRASLIIRDSTTNPGRENFNEGPV